MEREEEFLLKAFTKGPKIRKDVAEALIKSGALDHITKDRIDLLAKYRIFSILTERERKWTFDSIGDGCSFSDAVKALICSKVPNKTRKPKIMELINEIRRALAGNKKKMAIAFEKYYLGIPLSGSLVELYSNPNVNIKCVNFQRLREKTFGHMGVVIDKINTKKDKNGNWMCFLNVSDETYMLNSVVIFSWQYNKLAWILEEGKPVLLTGKKSDRGSFIVNNIEHL